MPNIFGYPECCVKWFEDRLDKKISFKLTYLQHKYNKHGFIPCIECAKKLESENMRLDQLIIKERRRFESFPESYPRNDEKIKESIDRFNKLFNK